MLTARSSKSRTGFLASLLCCAAGVSSSSCISNPAPTGQGTGGSSGTGSAGVSGTAGNTGNPGTAGTTGNPGTAGTTGNPGTAGTTGNPGTAGTTGNPGTAGTTGAAGNPGTAGTTGAAGNMGAPTTFKNYQLNGSMPNVKAVIPTKAGGTLSYTKVVVNELFYAESCSIADYNHDDIPDISAGRRWYEGPTFAKAHIFRGGHDGLPRVGASAELVDGVSDDWADWPWDMDGDGWADIINVASADAEERVSLIPKPQTHGTAFWFKNPGTAAALSADPAGATGQAWTPFLIHSDVRQEQHGLVDVNGDGKPEFYGACRDCTPTQTKGYYYGDWSTPAAATQPWKYQAVTPKDMYPFPFGGLGWLHGLGFGDVNGDGKPDLLERGGAWLQQANGSWPGGATTSSIASCTTTPASCGWVKTNFWNGNNGGNQGGSHMYAWDMDGDGDMDVVSGDWAHGEGFAWYEQTAGQVFIKHYFMNKATDKATYGVYFTEPHAAQAVDMDGDGVPDLITGKMRFAHPLDQGDPDPHGEPYLYVFKTVREATPGVSGKAHFEPHLVDGSPTATEGATGMLGGVGVGRQLAVGQINADGIPDICVSTKLGLYVFLGK
jgi:hypothetical protein